MELTLQKAAILWLAKPPKEQEDSSQAPTHARLTVLLPSAHGQDDEVSLPCSIVIPAEGLTTKNKTSLLDQDVTFKLLDDTYVMATHSMKLRWCIPVLSEGSVHWTQPVLRRNV